MKVPLRHSYPNMEYTLFKKDFAGLDGVPSHTFQTGRHNETGNDQESNKRIILALGFKKRSLACPG